MKYTIIKYRVYNKHLKKIKDFKAIVESGDVDKFIEFVNSGDRIVIFDEIKEVEDIDLIKKILYKVKDELQNELF